MEEQKAYKERKETNRIGGKRSKEINAMRRGEKKKKEKKF